MKQETERCVMVSVNPTFLLFYCQSLEVVLSLRTVEERHAGIKSTV